MFPSKRFIASLVVILVVVLAVGLFNATRVQAQGGVIAYGQVVSGSLTEQNPLAIYAFQGVEGQLIAAQVIGIPPAMKPTINLLSPSGQPLANSAEKAYLFSTDAQVSARLPQSGLYSLVINDASGAVGQFILRLALRGEGELPVIPANLPTPIALSAEAPSQTHRLQADALNPTQLSIITLDGAVFAVEVLSSSGRSLASFDGLAEVNVKLPAAEYFYLIVTRLQSSAGRNLIVSLSSAGVAVPAIPPTPAPPVIAPPITVQAPSGSTGTCQAFANGVVNVRAGPGTQYATLTQLSAGQSVVITGVNSNWYGLGFGQCGDLTGRLQQFALHALHRQRRTSHCYALDGSDRHADQPCGGNRYAAHGCRTNRHPDGHSADRNVYPTDGNTTTANLHRCAGANSTARRQL